MAGWLAGRPAGWPAAGGIEINTNSAHQLGLSWDLAGLSLAIPKMELQSLTNGSNLCWLVRKT